MDPVSLFVEIDYKTFNENLQQQNNNILGGLNNAEFGYKAFNADWKCRDKQYAVGCTYRHEGSIKLCSSGFHYCTNPLLVNLFYRPSRCNGKYKYALVKAVGNIDSDAQKSVTDVLEIVEEIPYSTFVKFGSVKSLVLNAVINCGNLLKYASEELKNDKEVVLTAVKKNGMSLKYASDELKKDKEVVLSAVSHSGEAFRFADHHLRQNDKDIILALVSSDSKHLHSVNYNLKNDSDFILAAVRCNLRCLQYAGDSLKNNKEFMLDVLQQIPNKYGWFSPILFCFSDVIRKEKALVLAAVKRCGADLEYASDELKNDKEVVAAAIEQDIDALKYASDNIKNDKDFVFYNMEQYFI